MINEKENRKSSIRGKRGLDLKSFSIYENKIGGEDSCDPAGGETFMSPQNAARYLDVSVKFIYERIQSGEIETQPVGRRIKRIKRGTLDKWLSAQASAHGR